MGTLILGSTGANVDVLQKQLLEAGESIDLGELRQAYFGPSTKAAVIDFQVHHVDAHGHPLSQDGVVGPKTAAALANPSGGPHLVDGWVSDLVHCDPRVRPVVTAAVSEIGVMESPPGSNRGPRVDVYTGLSGDDPGQPWCAAFVSYCWAQAVDGSPFGKKMSVLKIRDWAAHENRFIGASTLAQPGDLGLILLASGHGHVEMIVAPEVKGELISLVGGNVANGVRSTRRLRSAFSHMVRPLP
jgi:hypothetical protein